MRASSTLELPAADTIYLATGERFGDMSLLAVNPPTIGPNGWAITLTVIARTEGQCENKHFRQVVTVGDQTGWFDVPWLSEELKRRVLQDPVVTACKDAHGQSVFNLHAEDADSQQTNNQQVQILSLELRGGEIYAKVLTPDPLRRYAGLIVQEAIVAGSSGWKHDALWLNMALKRRIMEDPRIASLNGDDRERLEEGLGVLYHARKISGQARQYLATVLERVPDSLRIPNA